MDSKRKNFVLLIIGIIAVFLLVYININHKPTEEEPNVPLSGETNTFIRGNSYNLDFRSKNEAGIKYTYCYETQYQWIFSDYFDEDPCLGIEGKNKSLVSKINMEVRLKDTTTQQMFEDLNAQYGVIILPNPDGDDIIPLEISYQVGYDYNSYTLAQKYFSTGYFDIVRPTMTLGMGEEY